MAFLDSYKQLLVKRYPSTRAVLDSSGLERLVSPEVVSLPESLWHEAEKVAKILFRLSRNPTYLNPIAKEYPQLFLSRKTNASVLMSYDFHLTESGQLKLIEVNTNAAGYLITENLYHLMSPNDAQKISLLQQSFNSELQSLSRKPAPVKAAIVDDNVSVQKMYIEFLMYNDLFNSWGWQSQISEASKIAPPVDLIYNRSTDFTFSDPSHTKLLANYQNNSCVITPHPQQYLLLGHKSRLQQLYSENLTQYGLNNEEETLIKSVLIPTYHWRDLGDANQIWERRKELFFKPASSHGGKAAFKGSSISRKMFDSLNFENLIIQGYVAAPLHKEWKYDIRFYGYQDQIHMAAARLYQGQVTNFSTVGGGLAAINFVSK